jgi:hypothetical protein
MSRVLWLDDSPATVRGCPVLVHRAAALLGEYSSHRFKPTNDEDPEAAQPVEQKKFKKRVEEMARR